MFFNHYFFLVIMGSANSREKDSKIVVARVVRSSEKGNEREKTRGKRSCLR